MSFMCAVPDDGRQTYAQSNQCDILRTAQTVSNAAEGGKAWRGPFCLRVRQGQTTIRERLRRFCGAEGVVRYAILGDIHSNLEALDGVLADAQAAGADQVLCVGDVVGYGANPRECVDLMRELRIAVVAGNHDWATADRMALEYFNSDARDSIEWTRQQLQPEDAAYLNRLPLVHVLDETTLVHSSPFSPEYFDYLQTIYDVELAFDHLETSVCFVGHSHVPVFFVDTSPVDYFLRPELDIPPDQRLIVNVGSVGQPRDLDPRACYALYDTDARRVQLRRVEYDLQSASARIAAAGLPVANSNRIMLGR